MQPRRHLLTGKAPLAERIADHLCRGWEGRGALDLSAFTVIVPTAESGRRLRETLVLRAAAADTAMFSPRILLPLDLLIAPDDARVTHPVAALAAWTRVLSRVRPGEYPRLFPERSAPDDDTSRIAFAGELLALQSDLARAGYRVGDLPDQHALSPDLARWEELARLDRAFARELESAGLIAPHEAQLAAASRPPAPDPGSRLVIAAVPDLPRVVERFIGALPIEAEILINAPGGGGFPEDSFDACGRPASGYWSDTEIPLRGENLILADDFAAQSDEVATRVALSGTDEIGVCTPTPALALASFDAFRDRGIPAFDPAGRPMRDHPAATLLDAFRRLSESGAFPDLRALLQHPDLLDGLGSSPTDILPSMDSLAEKYLPDTLDDALDHAAGQFAELLRRVKSLADSLAEPGDGRGRILSLLREIYAGRDRTLAPDYAEVFAEIRAALDAASLAGIDDAATLVALSLAHLSPRRLPSADERGGIDLLGWLEMPWHGAPRLIVCGMNEGTIPSTRPADAWLPDSARDGLGMDCSASRLARDSYLLRSIVSARDADGGVILIAGKRDEEGGPLRPSRLLLRCAPDELPHRVQLLFAGVGTRAGHAPSVPWKLVPPPAAPRTKVSPSDLERYLACPFRFYLSRILKMEAGNPDKMEAAAVDFGDLIHKVLEDFGNDPSARESADEGTIRAYLETAWKRAFDTRFGADLSLPLLLQREAGKRRLGAVARVQSGWRGAGWQIQDVERTFDSLRIGGAGIRGKIDRIDRHAVSGEWMILDYKTNDKPSDPRKGHLKPVGAKTGPSNTPDYALVEIGGKMHRWVDLQLPIYLESQRETLDGAISLAHFAIPKQLDETAILPFDLGGELMASAAKCAEGAVRDILAGRFWPPAERVPYDDFGDILFGDPAATVDPRHLIGRTEGGK